MGHGLAEIPQEAGGQENKDCVEGAESREGALQFLSQENKADGD